MQEMMDEIVTLFEYRYNPRTERAILAKYGEYDYTDSLSELLNDCLIVMRSEAEYIRTRLRRICAMGTIKEKDILYFLSLEYTWLRELVWIEITQRKDCIDILREIDPTEIKKHSPKPGKGQYKEYTNHLSIFTETYSGMFK